MKPHPRILRVHNLSVQRDGCRILRKVCWTVMPGQNWAILGANGSGKTSLLKSITGYLMPSSGTIEALEHVYGEVDWRELRRHVGIVSSAVGQMIPGDEPALETVLSGPDAHIGLWKPTTATDRSTALNMLRRVGCGRLSDRPWVALSQGERQRIMIARALMGRPSLLVLDEPCAGLDPVAREHFLQFLNQLGRSHTPPNLILVTHHVEEIMPVFRHVLVLERGRILAAGPAKAALTSKIMSDAFRGRVTVRQNSARRYSLRVAPAPRAVV